MTSASACTAHSPVAHSDVGFLCSVDSTKMLTPKMSSDEVCSLFKAKIDEALNQKTVVSNDVPGALPANWIKVDVRFSMPGTATATVIQSTGGQETAHPEIAVDVMDKAMEPNDVGMLASAVGKYLSEVKPK
jgi:hypothetical protein